MTNTESCHDHKLLQPNTAALAVFQVLILIFFKLNFFLEVWGETFVISLLIIPLRVEILVIGPYP